MVKKLKPNILTGVLILFIGVFTTSCILAIIEGNVVSLGEGYHVGFAISSLVNDCSEESVTPKESSDASSESRGFVFSRFFQCAFAANGEENFSFFGLSGAEILFLLILDPIIVQVPGTATNFTGTFTGPGSGGPLSIQSGLTTIPADININIVAEAGMQLVILDFPDPPPGFPGNFTFNFGYDVPSGPFDIKVMTAGKVQAVEGTFYPPIYPCESDFANIPALNVPMSPNPVGIDLSPYFSLPGCNGLVYDYTGLTPIITSKIPTLSQWGLVAMAGVLGILGTVGILVMRRRKAAA